MRSYWRHAFRGSSPPPHVAMDAAQGAHPLAVDAVLFSADLFTALWPWLDRASKQALRCVNRAIRGQVDASIVVVASPSSGLSAAQLIHALSNWSGVRDLTLLGVSGASDLQPLATASLTRLTSLTVRKAGAWRLWGLTLSSSLGAMLRVLDVSGCRDLISIDFVRSCVQLRCLWMPLCFSVADLSPLAACSETLEELWMARSVDMSLAPLKACARLCKLDLRACNSELYDQVEDLQPAPSWQPRHRSCSKPRCTSCSGSGVDTALAQQDLLTRTCPAL